MGRICYEAIITCHNEEHENLGSNQARPDLVPDDKIDILENACKSILDDVDIGFLEKIFGFQTRIT